MARISVDLPAPFAPSTATISPSSHAQVDALEHRLGAIARSEPAELEQRRARRAAARAAPCAAAPRRGRPCAPPGRAALPRACRAAMRTPASSTTTWSEMPITTDMSCSTSTTAMPAVGDAAQQARELRLVFARQSGRWLVEQQHRRLRRQRARDLDQALVDVRQVGGARIEVAARSRRTPRSASSRAARGDRQVLAPPSSSRTAAWSGRCARCRRARCAKPAGPGSQPRRCGSCLRRGDRSRSAC